MNGDLNLLEIFLFRFKSIKTAYWPYMDGDVIVDDQYTMLIIKLILETLIFEICDLDFQEIALFWFKLIKIGFWPYMADDVIVDDRDTMIIVKLISETIIFENCDLVFQEIALFWFKSIKIRFWPYMADDVIFDDRFHHVNVVIKFANNDFWNQRGRISKNSYVGKNQKKMPVARLFCIF